MAEKGKAMFEKMKAELKNSQKENLVENHEKLQKKYEEMPDGQKK